MQNAHKTHFIKATLIALGLLVLLMIAARPTLLRPTNKIPFPSTFITYWGNLPNETALLVEEKAAIFDCSALFMPPEPVVQIILPNGPFQESIKPILGFGSLEIIDPNLVDTYSPTLLEKNFTSTEWLAHFRIKMGPPTTVTNTPHIWLGYANLSSGQLSPTSLIGTPAPLDVSLWPPIRFLIQIENDRILGQPLQENTTGSTEIDNALRALIAPPPTPSTDYQEVIFFP